MGHQIFETKNAVRNKQIQIHDYSWRLQHTSTIMIDQQAENKQKYSWTE